MNEAQIREWMGDKWVSGDDSITGQFCLMLEIAFTGIFFLKLVSLAHENKIKHTVLSNEEFIRKWLKSDVTC